MIPIPRPIKAPKVQKLAMREWTKGLVTAFDDGRTPIDGLRAAGNVMLDQDGTLRPRPSLIRYGAQPTGTLLGDLYEFSRTESGDQVNYLIGMFNDSGTVRPAYSKDGGAWTNILGKTYDTSARTHFKQVDNDKVLVTNGADNLSYVDLATMTITPFVALATPAAPTVAQTGMLGTNYTHYYRITANSTVGETAASTVGSVQTNKLRDVWDATMYIDVSWTAVPSARSYNVYWSDVSGEEVLIAAGINGLSYRDDGTAVPDITHAAPLGDTTAGPIVTRSEVINGQVFLVGDKDNPRYVRFGGTGDSILDFSAFNGGGWVEPGRSKEIPVKVTPPPATAPSGVQAMILCRGTNGTGKRYTMTPDTITVGEIVISYFKVVEDNGQDGTDSPDGAFIYRDALYYPSKDGFKKTGTKPQLQTFLSTDYISETISDDVKSLSSAYMDLCVGLAYQQRLYWALPVGSSTNNEIWVLDLQRKGAWMKWSLAASAMTLYNDNSGETHFIVVSGGVIYELSESQATMDDSTAFRTNATSGFLKFSEDGLDWGKIIDVTFVLLRPQGEISFSVSGRTEDGQLESVGGDSFISTSTVAGWGEAGWGGAPSSIYGWSNFDVVPVSYGDAARFVVIEPEDEDEVQWLTWELNTSGSGVSYQLADVIVRYVNIGPKDLA